MPLAAIASPGKVSDWFSLIHFYWPASHSSTCDLIAWVQVAVFYWPDAGARNTLKNGGELFVNTKDQLNLPEIHKTIYRSIFEYTSKDSFKMQVTGVGNRGKFF